MASRPERWRNVVQKSAVPRLPTDWEFRREGVPVAGSPAAWWPDPTAPRQLRWWDSQAWTVFIYLEHNGAGSIVEDKGGLKYADVAERELLPSGIVGGDHWSHVAKERRKRHRWTRFLPALFALACMAAGGFVLYQVVHH